MIAALLRDVTDVHERARAALEVVGPSLNPRQHLRLQGAVAHLRTAQLLLELAHHDPEDTL